MPIQNRAMYPVSSMQMEGKYPIPMEKQGKEKSMTYPDGKTGMTFWEIRPDFKREKRS